MRITKLLLCVFLSLTNTLLYAQTVAIKTNALYWATTTPNIGVELSLNNKHTAQLFYGLNPWEQSGGDHSKLRHWSTMAEYRHWFCQSFNGWFVGPHVMGGEFNLEGVDLPLGLLPNLKSHRYEGWYAGGGISCGYQWPISRHLNLEASLGVGYDYIKYDEMKCGTCGQKLESSHKNYFGPTKAAISLIYVIN